jgi:hypothetical protein
MRKKLTTTTVGALAPNGPKRFEVYDLTLPGFGIRVSTNGQKSWFCAARVSNRLRRHTLGPSLWRADAPTVFMNALIDLMFAA